MRGLTPPGTPTKTHILVLTAGLVGLLYLGAHLWLGSPDQAPSLGPAPAALRPVEAPPANAGEPGSTGPATPASRPPVPPFREIADTLSPDRTVGSELAAHGVGPAAVNELVAALSPVFDFRKARAGNKFAFTLRTADGRLTKFRYETGPLDVFEVERDAAGKLVAKKLDIPVRTEIAEIGAELQVSLYQAMKRAGESPTLVARLVDVFAFDLDFYKDPRPGDTFRVLVEKVYTGDKLIRYGRMLAAEYQSQKRGTFRVFHFESEGKGGVAGYFLEDGQSTRKTFLKTPLKFARVSSKFDLHRKHPILKYTRAHLGIDYAAKTGTPVWSMADGVVRKAAFERGFGNLVIVDHKNGLLSFYAHLNKFAKGIKAGVKVEQKQVVGTVGMTGLATGPHLHFGVKRNGGWVNPESLKMTRDPPVPAKLMGAFKKQVADWSAHLARIPVRKAPAEETDDSNETDDTADGVETNAPGPVEAANAHTSTTP